MALSDLVANIIRIPVDLGRGIVNLFTKKSVSPSNNDPTQHNPINQNTEAPPSIFKTPNRPKDLEVDPIEAQALVENPLKQDAHKSPRQKSK